MFDRARRSPAKNQLGNHICVQNPLFRRLWIFVSAFTWFFLVVSALSKFLNYPNERVHMFGSYFQLPNTYTILHVEFRQTRVRPSRNDQSLIGFHSASRHNQRTPKERYFRKLRALITLQKCKRSIEISILDRDPSMELQQGSVVHIWRDSKILNRRIWMRSMVVAEI